MDEAKNKQNIYLLIHHKHKIPHFLGVKCLNNGSVTVMTWTLFLQNIWYCHISILLRFASVGRFIFGLFSSLLLSLMSQRASLFSLCSPPPLLFSISHSVICYYCQSFSQTLWIFSLTVEVPEGACQDRYAGTFSTERRPRFRAAVTDDFLEAMNRKIYTHTYSHTPHPCLDTHVSITGGVLALLNLLEK